MCGKDSTWRSWALLLALAFSLAATSWADEPGSNNTRGISTSSTGSTPLASPTPTGSWESLDALLTELEAEATAQSEDLRRLLGQLQASQTEASALSTLLGQSARQLRSLEEALMQEREAAKEALRIAVDRGARAEKSRDRWRWAAIIAAVAGAAGWAAFGLSL